MHELRLAGDLITAIITIAVSTAWPPAMSGAFWAVAGFYGVVSVLFDDETPRGIPGIELLNRRPVARRDDPLV